MIVVTVDARDHVHRVGQELWIRRDEILRESVKSHHAAADTGGNHRQRRVERVGVVHRVQNRCEIRIISIGEIGLDRTRDCRAGGTNNTGCSRRP